MIDSLPLSRKTPSGREHRITACLIHISQRKKLALPISNIYAPSSLFPVSLFLQPTTYLPTYLLPTYPLPPSSHPSPSDHTTPDSPTLPSQCPPNPLSLQFAHEPHGSVQCVLATCLRFRLRALRFLRGWRRFGFGDSRSLRRWRRG